MTGKKAGKEERGCSEGGWWLQSQCWHTELEDSLDNHHKSQDLRKVSFPV